MKARSPVHEPTADQKIDGVSQSSVTKKGYGGRVTRLFSRNPFDWKSRRSNSGLFYLIGIALVTAVAAGVFRKDDSRVLFPVVIVIAAILVSMGVRRGWVR